MIHFTDMKTEAGEIVCVKIDYTYHRAFPGTRETPEEKEAVEFHKFFEDVGGAWVEIDVDDDQEYKFMLEILGD